MKSNSVSKIKALVLFTMLFTSFLYAQVNEPEIKSVGDETVEFINYTGPHTRIDSLAAIKEIGAGLGRTIARSKNIYTNAGDRGKYYVIHAVDPTEKGKLDADILFIGANATVDHITNLRRIISAYLSTAYGYSTRDADTLAVFVTVYNAVYRNNIEAFRAKYKSVVMQNLTQEHCGLSIRYSDWPGKSQIVIPLYDVDGGLSTVDTSVISDKRVVESMQEDDDKNIDSRKQMVDIKEREADNAAEKAQTAQTQATEEQKKADDAQKEADDARKFADEHPEDKEAQKVAEEKEKEAEEQQKKADDAKQEAKEAQAQSDKKQNEAQNERTQIAKDQKEVQEREMALAKADAVYGMQLTDEKKQLSGLVKVNLANGEVLHSSPVTFIRDRTFYEAGNGFIAIAGENIGNGTVKLVLLDSKNMEITKESNETVAEDSVLVKDGDDYYCIIQDGSRYVLAKYNQDLRLMQKSPVSLKSSSPVSVADKAIVVTGSNGRIVLLSKTDLTELKKEQTTSSSSGQFAK